MSVYKGTALRNDVKDIIEESPMDLVEYQASMVLPELPVKEKSGLIPVLSTSAGMKQLDLKRAPRSTFKRAEWVWGNKTYASFEYGYEEPIDNVEALENEDIFDEEVVAGNIARSQLFLAREKRVADAVFNTTTFTGASNFFNVTNEWDDATSATPYADITTAHDKLFAKSGIPRAQCHLLINEVIFRNIMRSDKVRADVKYTKDIGSAPLVEKAAYLAAFFGIKAVHVTTSFVDSTALGVENATFSRLWDNEYAMFYFPCPNVNSWRVKGLGRQPVYAKFADDYKLEDYPEPQTDSLIIRAREFRGEFVNPQFGVLIGNMTS